jgi:hypothetical protein
VDPQTLFERERARYEDGEARLAPEQLVRLGNAAYGAGLALLMLRRDDDAGAWLERAAACWRESWEHATPTSWGRPIGVLKALLLAGRDTEAEEAARWSLGLGTAEAESPIGRYAGCLALIALGEWERASALADSLRAEAEFPGAVAAALAAIAAGDRGAYAEAAEAVLVSFETRDAYLEDAAVADTVLALQALAARRGVAATLRPSAVLPG